ncbi:MAG: 5-oxoprolinase subunit PxpA [Clostridia bacterium]
MIRVDINCDMEEALRFDRLNEQEEILDYLTSINIPCGFHAGNPHMICRMLEIAFHRNINVGAHPGFPDPQSFGRRLLNVSMKEAYEIVLYQVSALDGMARALGGELNHVKLHGALYLEAAERPDLAEAVVQAVMDVNEDLVLYALSGSSLVQIALEHGLQVAEEVFADRIYLPNGRLAPREMEGSVMLKKDEIFQQATKLITEQQVQTVDGGVIELTPDTICIHRENVDTIAFLQELHEWAKRNDVSIEPINLR